MRQWYYSIFLFCSYLLTFHIWKAYPSRESFVVGGLIAVSIMLVGLILAMKKKCFVNKIDVGLHAVVILDVLIEGFLAEFYIISSGQNMDKAQLASSFHNTYGFYGCALAFAVVLGAYRSTRSTSF